MTRPVAPERMTRNGASTSVVICVRLRIAALRSALSMAAVSTAYDSSRAREVPRGRAGITMAARIATIASTHTISSSVKPASALPARDVLSSARSSLCSVGAVRKNVVGPVLSRRAVHIRIAPWIGRYLAAFQVGPVPGIDAAGTLYQRGETLGSVRITAGVEEEEVERAREALDLDTGRLDLRLGQVVEPARADDAHDQCDDGDDDQQLPQREAAFVSPLVFRVLAHAYPMIWLTERSEVITDTINPPTMIEMVMIAAGPTMPTMRSRLRCSFAS